LEVDQQVYEVAGAQLAIAVHHCASRRDILESVLAYAIASLKQHRTAVEIHPVARASILL